MIEAIVLVVLVWFLILFMLIAPTKLYTNIFNRITQGKYQQDKQQLLIMLDHLRSFPEQWLISQDGAAFPKDSKAKQIYISHDDKRGWEYTLNSFGNRARPLDGYFGPQFVKAIADQNVRQESKALLRDFFPELDGTLLIGGTK